MRQILVIVLVILMASCDNVNIRLNNEIKSFKSFPAVDSIKFESIANEVLGEPKNMLYVEDQLLINTMANSDEYFLINYSLKEKSIISKAIMYGMGPDEMLSCDMYCANDKIWLYDMGKQRLGRIDIDSLLQGNYTINKYYNIPMYFYNVAMLNDSIMIGTNNLLEPYKLSYFNIKNGKLEGRASYSYLNEKIPLTALLDASSCYVNIHPTRKDILLSYRYTDVIEIYDSIGNLKSSVQGPLGFDAEFTVGPNGSMEKIKGTHKAFVNSYVTSDYIYLLYSGCSRSDKNWAYGTQLFVYSWDGKPLKHYLLDSPVYTFAINEKTDEIYSYSIQTGELVKGRL